MRPTFPKIKTKDITRKGNYRPISLMSIDAKIFCKLEGRSIGMTTTVKKAIEKNEQNLRNLWNKNIRCDICVIRVPEEEGKVCGAEKFLNKKW